MAKLVRAERKKKIGPVGVVQMTGLRQMGEAMGTIGAAADQAHSVFTELAKQEAIEEEKLEFNKFSKLPSQERQAVIQKQIDEQKKENGELVYQENSMGRPQPLVPDQIPTRDTGIWSGVRAQTWNKMASEWNAMKAGNQIDRFINTKLSEQFASNNFNPTKFEQEVTAYADAVIQNTDIQAAASTRMLFDKSLHDGFNQLTSKRLARDELEWQAEHKVISDRFQSIIADAIRNNGVYDQALPDIAKGAWFHEMRKLEKAGIPVSAYPAQFEKFAKNYHIAGITYELNQKFGKAKTAVEVDAIAEKTYQDIALAKTDELQIPTLQFDPATNEVTIAKAPFSSLYDTPEEQDAAVKSWIEIVKSNQQLKTAINTLQISAMENTIMGKLNQAMLASEKEDHDSANRHMADLFKMFDGNKNADFNKIIRQGLGWLFKTKDFARGKVSEGLANIYSDEGEGVLDRLKKYASQAQLDEFDAYFPPVTEENFNNMKDNLDPLSVARQTKSKIVKLMEILGRTGKANKGYESYLNSYSQGERPEVSKSDQGHAQTLVNDMASGQGHIPDNETWIAFQHNAQENLTESNITIDLTRQIASQANIPLSFVNRARKIIQDVNAPPSQKQAVLKWYRAMKRENMFSRAELKENFDPKLFEALEWGYEQVELLDSAQISASVVQDMSLIYRNEKEIPMMGKESKTIATFADELDKVGNRWLSSDVPLLPIHKQTIAGMANKIKANNTSLSDEDAFDKAVDQFQKKNFISSWGIRGDQAWVKDPIERQYKNLVEIKGDKVKTGNLKTVLREQMRGMGDLKIGYETFISVDDLNFPDDPVNQGKGMQVRFMKSFEGSNVYTAYVAAFDPANPDASVQYVPITNEFGPIQIDVTHQNNIEGRRKKAVDYVTTMRNTREKFAQGLLTNIATFVDQGSFVGEAIDPAVWDSVVSSVQAQADVKALDEYLARLDKEQLNFDPEIFKMYQMAPLRTKVEDIMNLAKAMEQEEADSFAKLPKERQIEILKDYNLDKIRPQLEQYFELNLYSPESIMGTDYEQTMEPEGGA